MSLYFDYASTTPVDEEVKKLVDKTMLLEDGYFGNPGSLHSFGQKATELIDGAREEIAKTIGANYRDIYFTSGATEANNLVIRGIVKAYFRRGSCTSIPKIIISSVEHPSVLETVKDLEKDGAIRAIYLNVNKGGFIDLNQLENEIDESTILVSVMWVNNETGTIEPINKMVEIVKKFREKSKNIYPIFHTDAVQVFNLFDLNVNKSEVDMMTLSSHKIYGPKGAGVLYINQRLKTKDSKQENYLIAPIITGGGQERNLRSGTENVPAIVGFGKAAIVARDVQKGEQKRILLLSKYFIDGICQKLPRIELNSPIDNRAPHIINLFVPYKENLHIALDMKKVFVSAGSACSARMLKSSHVLEAMGYNNERSKYSVRFSFGKMTTKEDVDQLIKKIIEICGNK